MSRRKKPVQLLGPDGKPYVAPPKPMEPTEGLANGDTFLVSTAFEPVENIYRASYFGLADLIRGYPRGASPRSVSTLASVVADQLSRLVPSDLDDAPPELPAPPADLTTYIDAYNSAVKNCQHPNYQDVVYASREAQCLDCGRYFVRPRGMWG